MSVSRDEDLGAGLDEARRQRASILQMRDREPPDAGPLVKGLSKSDEQVVAHVVDAIDQFSVESFLEWHDLSLSVTFY